MPAFDGQDEVDLAARLTNVDLNLLPALLVLLQESGVTAAARRLRMSQPALSHALGRLRTLLGDELLVRVGNRSVLTPRAQALLPVVTEWLQGLTEAVLQRPGFDPARDARHFVISMTTSTAYVVGPLLLELIEATGSRSSVEIADAADPGQDIFTRPDIDVSLVADVVPTSYARSGLYVDRWVAIVARENTRVGSTLTTDDLGKLPHVGYRSPSVRTQPYVVMAAHGIHARLDLASSNFLLMPLLISGTDRLAIVQERLARTLADKLDLRVLDLPLPVPPLGIDVVVNPRVVGDAAVTWLVASLRHQMHSRDE